MLVHIAPDETQALQRIPRALLIPSPGRAKGHMLMAHNDKGHCPMLVEDQCTVYPHRPQTCRIYDCRIFAATGIAVDAKTQPDIAQRVKQWVFTYDSDKSRIQHATVKTAATFLQKNRHLFPLGSLPTQLAHLAALALRVYKVFSGARAKSDDLIVRNILDLTARAQRPHDDFGRP